jgi:hypothetical protein
LLFIYSNFVFLKKTKTKKANLTNQEFLNARVVFKDGYDLDQNIENKSLNSLSTQHMNLALRAANANASGSVSICSSKSLSDLGGSGFLLDRDPDPGSCDSLWKETDPVLTTRSLH